MERYEIPESPSITPWIEAVERGEQVVIVRDGEAIAELTPIPRRLLVENRSGKALKLEELVELRARLPIAKGADKSIRTLRDQPDW